MKKQQKRKLFIGGSLAILAILGLLCASLIFKLDFFSRVSAVANHKKIIEYGWDQWYIDPTYIAKNIRSMEQKPFDGIAFKLTKDENTDTFSIFSKNKWDMTKVDPQINALKSIKWRKFTDNFIAVNTTADTDWFSDDDWSNILSNTSTLARAVKAGRCEGIVFDPEAYGPSPWDYKQQKYADSKTFEEYQAITEKRGSQFVSVLQKNRTSTKIMALFLLDTLNSQFESNDPDLQTKLKDNKFGLIPSFVKGMISAAAANTVIYDGNEDSYFYTSKQEFSDARTRIHGSDSLYLPKSIQNKYLYKIKAGNALYVDYIYSLRPEGFGSGDLSKHLTDVERTKWFESNTYYALKNTDKYVWIYSERMDWWSNTNIPPGLIKAITSAKAKYMNNQPLGFSIQNLIYKARLAAGQ